MNNKHKNLITENENIFKSFIMEKSVLPKLKRDSQVQKQNRGSLFRIDTIGALNNLIHQKTFIEEMKQKEATKKMIKKVKNFPGSPPSGKRVMFADLSDPQITDQFLTKKNGIKMLQSLEAPEDYGRIMSADRSHIQTNSLETKRFSKIHDLKKDFYEFSKAFSKPQTKKKTKKKKNPLPALMPNIVRKDSNLSNDSNDPKRRHNVIGSIAGIGPPGLNFGPNGLPIFDQLIDEEDNFNSEDDLSEEKEKEEEKLLNDSNNFDSKSKLKNNMNTFFVHKKIKNNRQSILADRPLTIFKTNTRKDSRKDSSAFRFFSPPPPATRKIEQIVDKPRMKSNETLDRTEEKRKRIKKKSSKKIKPISGRGGFKKVMLNFDKSKFNMTKEQLVNRIKKKRQH